MNRILQTVLLILMLTPGTFAQDPGLRYSQIRIYRSLFDEKPGYGTIEIRQDEKLERMLGELIRLNAQYPDIPRYWIRIFSGSGHGSREQAYAAKGQFLSKYEGIRSEVIYKNPNYKVYVGGYRSKSEALKVLRSIKKDFPYAFIIFDRMNLPEP